VPASFASIGGFWSSILIAQPDVTAFSKAGAIPVVFILFVLLSDHFSCANRAPVVVIWKLRRNTVYVIKCDSALWESATTPKRAHFARDSTQWFFTLRAEVNVADAIEFLFAFGF